MFFLTSLGWQLCCRPPWHKMMQQSGTRPDNGWCSTFWKSDPEDIDTWWPFDFDQWTGNRQLFFLMWTTCWFGAVPHGLGKDFRVFVSWNDDSSHHSLSKIHHFYQFLTVSLSMPRKQLRNFLLLEAEAARLRAEIEQLVQRAAGLRPNDWDISVDGRNPALRCIYKTL